MWKGTEAWFFPRRDGHQVPQPLKLPIGVTIATFKAAEGALDACPAVLAAAPQLRQPGFSTIPLASLQAPAPRFGIWVAKTRAANLLLTYAPRLVPDRGCLAWQRLRRGCDVVMGSAPGPVHPLRFHPRERFLGPDIRGEAEVRNTV